MIQANHPLVRIQDRQITDHTRWILLGGIFVSFLFLWIILYYTIHSHEIPTANELTWYSGYHTDYLSHIVMPFHVSQIDRVINNLRSWDLYWPSTTFPATSFVFYLSSFNQTVIDQCHSIWNNLNSKSCFKDYSIIHANLTSIQDTYFTGSRLMLERMLLAYKNYPEIGDVSYIMYMEPDALPIRHHWLSWIDLQVRFPILPFWIKGSVFRGENRKVGLTKKSDIFFHINGNSIYNLRDATFRHFYFQKYKPYIISLESRQKSFDTQLFLYLSDPVHYNLVKHWIHYFQYTDVIQNHWHSSYNLTQLLQDYPNTYIIHGGHSYL